MTVRVAAMTAFIVLTSAALGREPAAAPETTPSGFPYTLVLLLRDAAVQRELQLTDEQKKAIAAVIAQVDEPLPLVA